MALNYKSSLSRYRRYLQVVQSQPLFATSLWVIFSLVLLIVLLVLALRPTLITIADLMSKIQQQREISARLEDQILVVQEALTNLGGVRDQVYLLDLGLPKDALWDKLAENLYGMASVSGVTLEDVIVNKVPLTPSELVEKKQESIKTSTPRGIFPIRFTVVANGDYEQVKKMVELVEKMGRVSIINSMKIETPKEGGFKVTIQAETGYLPDKFVL